MEIDKDSLEKALSSNENSKENSKKEAPKMPKEMEIGFHQGALNTLASERMELIKMIQNVEKIMGLHLERLKSLGVKFEEKKNE